MIYRDLQELTMCNEKLLFVMNLNYTHGFIDTISYPPSSHVLQRGTPPQNIVKIFKQR